MASIRLTWGFRLHLFHGEDPRGESLLAATHNGLGTANCKHIVACSAMRIACSARLRRGLSRLTFGHHNRPLRLDSAQVLSHFVVPSQ